MTGSVEVSHNGLERAGDALQNQADEAQGVLSYVQANCADNGAFGSGFLKFFSGTYGTAYSEMVDVLQRGVEAANNRTSAMAATLADYISRDEATALQFSTMQPTIGPGVPFTDGGGGVPELPEEVTVPTKAGNLGANAPGLMDEPMNTPGKVGSGFVDQFNPNSTSNTPLSPIDVVDQTVKITDRFDGIANAQDDGDDMDDFIDRDDR